MNLTGKYVKVEFRGGHHDGETIIVRATAIPRELFLPPWDRYAATDSEFTYDIVTVNEAHVHDEPDFLAFMLQDARPFVLVHQG